MLYVLLYIYLIYSGRQHYFGMQQDSRTARMYVWPCIYIASYDPLERDNKVDHQGLYQQNERKQNKNKMAMMPWISTEDSLALSPKRWSVKHSNLSEKSVTTAFSCGDFWVIALCRCTRTRFGDNSPIHQGVTRV